MTELDWEKHKLSTYLHTLPAPPGLQSKIFLIFPEGWENNDQVCLLY